MSVRRHVVDGMMMDFPLTLQMFLERSRRLFPDREIVTRQGTGVERSTYADLYHRSGQLANALRRLGIQPGDRIGSFAWNHSRHLELYFGGPCSGIVLQTVNIRLFPDQTAYVINHGGIRVLFADRSLLPAIEAIRPKLHTLEQIVVLDGGPAPEGMLSYEELLTAERPEVAWPTLDENSACLICYTSGTTGNPKGVVYSHRAMVLHAIAGSHQDVAGIGERDVVLAFVPMFHANAWGLPFMCTGFGAKQVMPGAAPLPADLLRLLESERVTLAAGVPTVWLAALPLFQQGTYDVSSLRTLLIGGSAVPRSLVTSYRELGIEILQGYGMTETSPIVSTGSLRREVRALTVEDQDRYHATQGIPALGCELKIVDEAGNEVPWDGTSYGEIVVRGPWVTSGYFRIDSSDRFTPDGWFRTGDVATMDHFGYIHVVDRTKDLVKSGGEWISSVELENALMGHPDITEAAVIAVPHDRWMERPMACVVVRPEARGRVTAAEIVEFLRPSFPTWWLPDSIAFIDEVPKTSVGKFDKKVLRVRQSSGDLHVVDVGTPSSAYS